MSVTVFVVTSGEYSDFHVDAIFSTQAQAEAFINKAEDFNIEPWALDEMANVLAQQTYQTAINCKTGDVLQDYTSAIIEIHPPRWAEGRIGVDWRSKAEMAVGRSTVSQKHALKIAFETRQKSLRAAVTEGPKQSTVSSTDNSIIPDSE